MIAPCNRPVRLRGGPVAILPHAMSTAIPPRLKFAELRVATSMIALAIGGFAGAQAGEPVDSAVVAPAPRGSRTAVRRALREFDRFLDHHPLLEEQLRRDSRLTADKLFLQETPDLDAFLRANPDVTEGLKVFPRYYLNRALMRQANAPLSFRELAPLKDLFQAQPALEKELRDKPESICDLVFLGSHPALRDFLVQHPALRQVFLSPAMALEPK